jgi:hypothetical protein
MLDILNLLVGPSSQFRLGEAADLTARMLPWFDLERRVGQIENCFVDRWRRDEAEETLAMAPEAIAPADDPESNPIVTVAEEGQS